MNSDIAAGKWKQIRGELQRRWGKLTNNDLDQINGNYDKLVGKVQELYGHERAAIERELKEMDKLAGKVAEQSGDVE